MQRIEIQKEAGEPGTYSGQIVEKSGSSPGEGQLLYLRLSMGDYLIRCSGSGISDAELRQKVDDFVTLRGEIRAGEVKSLSDGGDCLHATGLVD